MQPFYLLLKSLLWTCIFYFIYGQAWSSAARNINQIWSIEAFDSPPPNIAHYRLRFNVEKIEMIICTVTWHRWNYNVWDRSGFSTTELYIFCLLLWKFWAIFLFEKTLRNEFIEFSLALFFFYWCVVFFVLFTFATFPLLEVDEIKMSPAYVNKYFLN